MGVAAEIMQFGEVGGCFWLLLLCELVLIKYLLLSEVDHVRTFSLGTCAHFNNFYRESPSENIGSRDVFFVVVPSFS